MSSAVEKVSKRIIDNDYHCGDCGVMDWCGKISFSELAICKNLAVNELTEKEYIEIAKEIDIQKLQAKIIESGFEDEEEYDDYLMQLICAEVEKKVCTAQKGNCERYDCNSY